MTRVNGKDFTVKAWMASKLGFNHEAHVVAILKETEKAVYCTAFSFHGEFKTSWMPKSALEENKGDTRYHFTECTFNEALEASKDAIRFWS